MKLIILLTSLAHGFQYGRIDGMDTCGTTAGGWGWDLTCPLDSHAVGFCSSGRQYDCNNSQSSHVYTCCESEKYQTLHRNCYEKLGGYG